MSSHLRCRPAALSFALSFDRYSLACLRTTLVMFTLRPSLSLCSSALPSRRWVGEEEVGGWAGGAAAKPYPYPYPYPHPHPYPYSYPYPYPYP